MTGKRDPKKQNFLDPKDLATFAVRTAWGSSEFPGQQVPSAKELVRKVATGGGWSLSRETHFLSCSGLN